MSITISNLRIIPYGQKDTLKPVFGDTMHLTFRLADAPLDGDRYLLGLDYERILFPTMRPLCAYTEDYTADQNDVSFDLAINTERFALWASTLKKPTPIWLQLVRVRGEEYTTILLDDILALPSVVDGANMVFPGTPLEDILESKADLVGGKVPLSQLPPIGFEQQQADWDESDSSEPSYIRNKPTDFGSQWGSITGDISSQSDLADALANKANLVGGKVPEGELPTIPSAPIIGTTAPTTSTAGSVGQLYVDTTTSKTYHCTAATNTGTEEEPVLEYTWTDDVNAYGGRFGTGSGTKGVPVIIGTATLGANPNRAMLSVGDSHKLSGGSSGFSPLLAGFGNNNNSCGAALLGGYLSAIRDCQLVTGLKNIRADCWRVTGGALSIGSDSSNVEELSLAGDLCIAGGFQQKTTQIPSATTAYTLAEGQFQHIPSSAPTYTMPDVPMQIVADFTLFTREASLDGAGYYGWAVGSGSRKINRYTSSATPAVGDNTYTNTALTAGAKGITAIDERTHEIILTVRFSSSVLTYAFEDSSGNTITPLPLAGTIADGSVVCFRCTWEALLNQWVVMPVMLGTYAEVEP